MICPTCLSEIQDDSSYCDQCGSKIMICPTCGTIGKTDFCFNDGVKLVLNSGDKNFTKNSFFQTERLKPSTHQPKLNSIKLINKNLSLEILIDKETVLGRSFGKYADVFSNYKQISSKHVLLKYEEKIKEWFVVDMNSSNGTKLNNTLLSPGKEYAIKSGDFLTLANIEFFVE